jgi:hypothetical protein
MLRKSYHTDADMADKFDSAWATAFVASMLEPWDPEWAREMYEAVRENYVGRYEFDFGAYVLESLPESAEGKLKNIGDISEPGMVGEGALALLLMWVASRDFHDGELFDDINKTVTNITHPQWVEYEIRCVDDEPSGIPGYTVGQLYNMFQGWSFFAKVHLGWDTIINYDWSQNRDSEGRLLDYGMSP